jgi:hypothetical protein
VRSLALSSVTCGQFASLHYLDGLCALSVRFKSSLILSVDDVLTSSAAHIPRLQDLTVKFFCGSVGNLPSAAQGLLHLTRLCIIQDSGEDGESNTARELKAALRERLPRLREVVLMLRGV